MFRPIVGVAFAFAAGIAAARGGPFATGAWLLGGLAACGAAGVLLLAGRSAAVPLLGAVVCAGALLYLHDARPPPDDPFIALDGRRVTLTGVVAQPPQVRGPRTRLVVAAQEIRAGEETRRVSGRVQVSVRGDPDGRYGDRVRVSGRLARPPTPGNPGEFSFRDHLTAQGIRTTLVLRRGDGLRVLERGRGHPLLAAVSALRGRIAAFFASALPGDRGALLLSLLLGDDGAIGPELRTAFTRAGLLHVLVVSGAQVGLVLATAVWLARLLHAPPWVTGVAGASAVAVFALMAGWVPSVARATVMAILAAAAVAGPRRYDVAAAMALAAIALLASSPLLLFDAGFQLSFVATWALVYVAPVLRTRLGRLPRPVATLIAMSVAAQTAVMPILAYHFQQVQLAGFAANLVVVPLVAALVPGGFAVAMVGLTVPALGTLLAWPLGLLTGAVALLARAFAAVPGASIPVFPPPAAAAIGAYGLLVFVVEVLRGRLRPRRAQVAAAALAVVAAFVWGRVLEGAGPGRLSIVMLDVGQGDAIVVRGPSGRTVLIDGGGEVEGHLTGYDVGERRVVPALRRLRIRALDVVILSHPHEDHAGGLVAVLQNFRVGLVLDSGLPHPAPSYARFRQLVGSRGIPYRLARRGQRLDLGDGVVLTVLLPEEPLITGSGADANLNSVVVRLTFHRVAVLLTGDMEALNESQLLELGDEVRSAVLKVAHHGSDTGTTAAFVDAVRPSVALISAGRLNPFGHPHAATLAILEDGDTHVYRTDRDGAITVETDGARLAVRTARP